jgi:hypothetical protein
MKRVLFASVLAVALTAPVLAQGPAGQTFTLAAGEGGAQVEFDQVGTFTLTVDETVTTGVYTYSDGELCLTGSEEGAETACEDWTDLEIGESASSTLWTVDGEPVTVTRIA